MNNKINLWLLCLLVLVSILSYGQKAGVYVDLELEGLEPLWITSIYDSTIVGHEAIDPIGQNVEFDGYSHVYKYRYDHLKKPLIVSDTLYSISSTFYDGDLSGGIIEKIDLRTGEVLWKSVFDRRYYEHRETIETYHLRDDTLYVIGIKVTTPRRDSLLSWPVLAWGLGSGHGGYLSVRKYDVSDGRLLSLCYADEDNPAARFIEPYSSGQHQMRMVSDTVLECWSLITDIELGNRLIVDSLDLDGLYLNSTDTIYSSHDIDWSVHSMGTSLSYRFADDGSVCWADIRYPRSEDETKEVKLVHIKEGRVRRIDLDYVNELINGDTYGGFSIYLAKRDSLLVAVRMGSTQSGEFISGHFLMDYDGLPISELRVVLDDDNGELHLDYFEMDDYGNYIYHIMDRQDDGYNDYNFYSSTSSGIEQVASFEIKAKNYELFPVRTLILDNGDYLAEVRLRERRDGSQIGRFHFMMRLSPDMLGISTSTEPDVKQPSEFVIFPNPVVDELQIVLPEYSGVYQVTLIDQRGIVVRQVSLSAKMGTLDVSTLSTGVYRCRVQYADGQASVRSFVKLAVN